MTQIDSTPIGAIRGGAIAAVDVRDLGKDFRRRGARGRGGPALAGVTLTVRRGECVAVLSDAKAVRRLVNRVSVEASFFKKLSAAENLHYAARFYGITARRTRERIPEILARVGFPPDRRGEPMENLSRGMQQKVALARALLTSPVLLLLDEPTTGLDPRSKLEVQTFVREVWEAHDATILLCTHDLAEAEALADRVGILDRGELLCLEPVDDLKRRYDASTLEDAFFTATGRVFEDERPDREVTG
jgi:ABC-2 type transport system ATP-binding protein